MESPPSPPDYPPLHLHVLIEFSLSVEILTLSNSPTGHRTIRYTNPCNRCEVSSESSPRSHTSDQLSNSWQCQPRALTSSPAHSNTPSLSSSSLSLHSLTHSSKKEEGKEKERRGGLEQQQQEKAMEIT